ncbi:MAG: SLBB domain-containing protein, partial [Desulfobacterales bacterium]|nr:SLBB domain-containing protein [Desulfobacterales bacterium]
APGDSLDILVPGQKEMSQIYDIGPDGNIYMVALGKIHTAGLDLLSLTKTITEMADKYIQKGDKILIRFVEHKRYIHIQGGVRYAGWYRTDPVTTLEELLENAGGLLSEANYSQIKLIRKVGDVDKEIGLAGPIVLESNDVLFVPMPLEYSKTIDAGDLLFVSIPHRRVSLYRTDDSSSTDSSDFVQELKRNQIEVDTNGYLYIPNFGHIYVRGLTTEQIVRIISDKLPKYLSRAETVEVNIVEKKHYVNVFGHVGSPGRYNIQEGGNIQEALTISGGAIDGSVLSNIRIQRVLGGRLRQLKLNLYQFIITGDSRLLTPLHENDTIFVPITENFGNIKRTLDVWRPPAERLEQDVKSKVRIFGAVNNPGIYEPGEKMNLIDLLVLASGGTDDADLSKILVIRNEKIVSTFNLKAWLDGVEEAAAELPKIENGDTVYVYFVMKKEFEPDENKIFFAIGNVRGPGFYKLYDQMTVLQALATAGGLGPFAKLENIMIIRMVEGKQENIPFNYNKAIQGKYPELNIFISPRDTIVVP